MSIPGTSTPATRNASLNAEEKPGYRTKTVATRITPEELREVVQNTTFLDDCLTP